MIALLFLLACAEARPWGKNSEQFSTTLFPIRIHGSACDFLAPLSNYTIVGEKVQFDGYFNIPLENISGKKLNLTNENGTSAFYTLQGIKHLFTLRESTVQEIGSECNCLSELLPSEGISTIIGEESVKACGEYACLNSDNLITLWKDMLYKIQNEGLKNLDPEKLQVLETLLVLNESQIQLVNSVKNGSISPEDNSQYLQLNEQLLSEIDNHIYFYESVKLANCEAFHQMGKLLHFDDKKPEVLD